VIAARQAGLARPVEVAHGGASARDDHQVGVGELVRCDHQPDVDIRLGSKRIDVSDVGQPR
jgi:hypothetical protein